MLISEFITENNRHGRTVQSKQLDRANVDIGRQYILLHRHVYCTCEVRYCGVETLLKGRMGSRFSAEFLLFSRLNYEFFKVCLFKCCMGNRFSSEFLLFSRLNYEFSKYVYLILVWVIHFHLNSFYFLD